MVAGLVGSGGGGLTPLVFAAREGDLESARLLLEAGANVDQQTEYGWTPLLTAVNNRNYLVAQFLIEQGANVNLPNKGGWTPLYLAMDNRNIEGGDYPVPKADLDHLQLIELLLQKGANPNLRVKDNTLTRTIFTMQWFFEDGATPFVRAAQSSDTALMSLLLKHGADPKIVTAGGDSALTAAGGIGWVDGVTYERSAKENLEAVRMLLDLGLDPNHAQQRRAHRADGRGPQGPRRRDPVAGPAGRASRCARPRQPRHPHPGGARRRRDLPGHRLRGRAGAGRRPVGGRAPGSRRRDPPVDAGTGLDAPAVGRTLNSICVVPLCQTSAP